MTGLLVLGTMERSRASLLLRQLLIILSKLEQSLWVSLNNINTVNSLGAQQSGPLWELVVNGKTKKNKLILNWSLRFSKILKLWSSKPPSNTITFFTAINHNIITITINKPWNTETQKTEQNRPITITNMTFWTRWSKLLFHDRSSKIIDGSEKCKHQFAVKRQLTIMFHSEWRLELFKLCT